MYCPGISEWTPRSPPHQQPNHLSCSHFFFTLIVAFLGRDLEPHFTDGKKAQRRTQHSPKAISD